MSKWPRGTLGMVRPGRDVSVPLPATQSVALVAEALRAQGFTSQEAAPDGTVILKRGRTGLGVAVEAASDIIPLWLLPWSRKHMFAFTIHVRTLTSTATESTLRLDLHRRASAAIVDQHFDAALRDLHAALESRGVPCVWSSLTDSARKPRR